MRTLHGYLLREMIVTLGVAVMVCSGLLLVGNLLKEILALLMTGQATLTLVVRGIALLLPFILAFALPMGVLTAALLVFGRLSADQELTAARANGISLQALAAPVLLLALGLCGLCAWVNMDLAPRCRVAYKGLFFDIAREQARHVIPAGRFVTDFPGFVIYANQVRGDELEDVLFFQFKDGRRVRDVRAPRAKLELIEDQRRLRLTFFDARDLEWMPRPRGGGLPGESGAAGESADPGMDTPVPPEPAVEDLGGPVEGRSEGADAGEPESAEPGTEVRAASDSAAGPGLSDAATGDPGDLTGPLEATRPDGVVEVVVSNQPPSLASPLVALSSGSGEEHPGPAAGQEAAPDAGDDALPGFWQPVLVAETEASVALPAEVAPGGLPALGDMTWRQLWNERRELRRLGLEDLTPIEVQLHRQVAFSFASLGFVLVGIPLGVRAHRRETSVGVAVAVGLVLVYYGFLVVAQAFETRMDAAPWLIVWMPNVLFQITGGWLLWRSDRVH